MTTSLQSSVTLDPKPLLSWSPDTRTRLVLRLLQSLQFGELKIILPDASQRVFVGLQRDARRHIVAEITIHDSRVFNLALSRGDIGFGEAYMQGYWSSPDPAALLKLLLLNRHAIDKMIYGRWWSVLWDQVRHLLRSNRRAQAKKNIAAHYDLGNDFYQVWLDPSMSYSSALFDGTGCWESPVSLEEGQHRKIHRAIEEIGPQRLGPGASILEIGCGWGALGEAVLKTTPAQYVGLTLSEEQQRWAKSLLNPFGHQRFDVRLQDYRDENRRYDAIISIEMFEAVGERYWEAYFSTLTRCLKSDGVAVIQTITIDERLFDRYRRSTDFIQQYIFPGGMLPSPTVFEQQARQQGLRIEKAFAFGQDYGRTLAEWAKRFESQRARISALGFDERFIRMWRFYLAYCEAGFAQGDINVMQYTLRHA